MGAEVVAISSSPSKKEESKRLGATSFLNHNDAEEMKAASRTFHVLLNTVSAELDYPKFFELLRPRGNFATVGAPPQPMQIRAPDLFKRNISISGSLIGPPSEIEEMLEFCEKNGVTPDIDIMPLKKANEAIDNVLQLKARYRYVLDIDSDFDKQQRKSD